MRIFGLFAFLTIVLYVEGRNINGYIVSEAAGKSYKIVFESQDWKTARESCVSDGAKLAVPKTENEFIFIQKLVRGMYYPDITHTEYKWLVWLGINNIDDYTVWKNVDGENISKTGYHKWSGDNGKTYSDDPAEPHCGGLDPVNPGLRDWWCHRRQPFVCEKKIPKEN